MSRHSDYQLPERIVFVSSGALTGGVVHETRDVAVLVVKMDVSFVCGGIYEPEQGSDVASGGIVHAIS